MRPVRRQLVAFAASAAIHAALALSLTLPRYYLWEQRALEGLVRACEPRSKGQAAHERHQVAVLEKEVGRLRLDCARQQALVRASQRTMSLAVCKLPAPKPAPGTGAPACGSRSAGPKAVTKTADGGKAKRKRRPVARALKAVAALQAPLGEGIAADSLAAASVAGAEVVQRSVPSSSLATADIAPASTAPSDVAVPQT